MDIAYIGMGANLPSPAGSPEHTLSLAAHHLNALGRLRRRSRLYSTAPVGFADQPRFLNAVVALETSLSPHQLLAELLRIERAFGRDRSSGIHNGPRTLDLDLLLFGDQVIHEADLVIPHPRLHERAFVLVPLAEIASNVTDAARQLTIAQLLNRLPTENHAIFPFESSVWRDAPLGCGISVAGPDQPLAHGGR